MTQKKKVMVVFGTRPEAIKMCPLVKELKKHDQLQVTVAVTGQHKEMLQQVLDCFEVEPDYDLQVMKPSQTLFSITEEVLEGMKAIYEKEQPELVLVHGDTSTAFASALAAYYMQIPVGHVEAGLRTYNVFSPYPEEFNRQAIGSVASYHFAPTAKAREQLLQEGKKAERIFVTGNTVIDALKTTVKETFSNEIIQWAADSRLVVLTAHRRENLGDTMEGIFGAIRQVVEEHEDVKVIYPVHLNPAVKNVAKQAFGDMKRIRLVEPMEVLEFHNVIAKSYLILTDSGGIQEEAPALGKPVLVLRDTTERPEGVQAGTLLLTGTDPKEIYRQFSLLLDDMGVYDRMRRAVNPYGDGTACEQIAAVICRDREDE